MKIDYVENKQQIEFTYHGNLTSLAPGRHRIGTDKATRPDGSEVLLDADLAAHLDAHYGSGIRTPQLRWCVEYPEVLDSLLESVREGRER